MKRHLWAAFAAFALAACGGGSSDSGGGGNTAAPVGPSTLAVLIAQGMLTYFGPKGWLSQFLLFFHLYEGSIRLTSTSTRGLSRRRRQAASLSARVTSSHEPPAT